MLPMTAYCNRCSGLASALAPTSRRKQLRPADVGMADPIAGRSIPGIRCKPKSAAAITPPLLPALTKPLTRPSSTIWIPRTIEEDFLVRTACAGCSSMAITSGASSICAHLPAPDAASAASTFALTPTKMTSTPSSRWAWTPPATTWSGAKSPPIASSAIFMRDRLGERRLDVQVAHGLRVRLDESLPGIDVVAHQDVEDLVGLDGVFDLDPQQHAVLWVHRGVPELLRAHFTETLVAGDLRFSGHLGQLAILLLVGVCVADLFAARDLVKRRLRDVKVLARDHRQHVAEEEGEKQSTDVRAIDVSVRHQNHMVIPQLTDVEPLTNPGAERGDEVADLLGGEDLVLARRLDVEDFAAQWTEGLEATIPGAFRRATRGVALHQVDLAQTGVALRAVRQLAGQRR